MCVAKKLQDMPGIVLHRLSIMDNLEIGSVSDLCKAKSIQDCWIMKYESIINKTEVNLSIKKKASDILIERDSILLYNICDVKEDKSKIYY